MLCCPHFRATVIELAQGHTACRSWSRDLNRYLGLKPACLTPTWSPWKPHQLLRVQLEHSSQHFIMFNSPTLRPFVSLCVCMCVCFNHVYTVLIHTFPHTLPGIAQHSIPQASDVRLQDPKSLFFPPDHSGQESEQQRKDLSLRSSLTYLTGSLWTK